MDGNKSFHEICIYEAKLEKQEEIETLMREVKAYYLTLDGVESVTYVKRTYRQDDFESVKNGEPPIPLTRYVGKVTYVLHLVVRDPDAHAALYKPALEKFYKCWNRCLITMPKIILGEEII